MKENQQYIYICIYIQRQLRVIVWLVMKHNFLPKIKEYRNYRIQGQDPKSLPIHEHMFHFSTSVYLPFPYAPSCSLKCFATLDMFLFQNYSYYCSSIRIYTVQSVPSDCVGTHPNDMGNGNTQFISFFTHFPEE